MPTGVYNRTVEYRENMSKAKKMISIETRRKMSESAKESHKNLGCKHSEEHTRKQAEARWRGGKKVTKKRMYEKNKKNLQYRLNQRMRSSIWCALKKSVKNGRKWEELVGYTVEQLKKHLKSTMPDNYLWQDFLDGELHIDHIIPISAFNFDIPEHLDFRRCWALENLRLLPKKENLSKFNKIIMPFQTSLKIAL